MRGDELLGWVVKWQYRACHHRVGCSVGKIVEFWAWLAHQWELFTKVSIALQLSTEMQWGFDLLIKALMVVESVWVFQLAGDHGRLMHGGWSKLSGYYCTSQADVLVGGRYPAWHHLCSCWLVL